MKRLILFQLHRTLVRNSLWYDAKFIWILIRDRRLTVDPFWDSDLSLFTKLLLIRFDIAPRPIPGHPHNYYEFTV